eukprot:Phypoly_transcript_00574.p1 GENE.Phypoly_transcript_00574~~Phypoly_transcript_00574.p1  ORF type:complete len:1439 (+),score=257.01 Phypoly_transcript_00574:52-4317(+)
MEEPRGILYLIRKLSKQITGRSDSSIVRNIYEHLLNLGEEEARIIDFKDAEKREEHNNIKFSTIQFHLRQRGEFERADALDYLVSHHPRSKNKHLCAEQESVMSILLALFETNTEEFDDSSSVLVSQRNGSIMYEDYRLYQAKKKAKDKDDPETQPAFEVFSEDIFTKIPGQKDVDEFAVSFSQLTDRMDSLPETESSSMNEVMMLPTHELENRRTLFGALSHFSAPLTGNDLDMVFSLPPLPDMETYEYDAYIPPTSLDLPSLQITPKKNATSPSKNGKALVPMVSAPPPQKSISKESIWDKAVALAKTPQPTHTWETTLRGGLMDGQADQSITSNSHQMLAEWLPPTARQLSVSRPKRPFFTESGVDIFDAVYTKHFDHELAPSVPVVKQHELVEECLCVLQGIPTAHFPYDEKTSSFKCALVRLKSSGHVSLHKLMTDIASVGSNFKFLEIYVATNENHTTRRGLVCQAFAHTIAMFLQFIRACIIDLRPAPHAQRLTLLEVAAHARAMNMQLAFVRLLCNTQKRGAALLGYLYDEVRRAAHSVTHQALLRLFLQSAARPYLAFVHSWIYDGRIADPYGEFVVTSSLELPHLSAHPDERFWHDAYLLRDTEEYVPNFIQNVLAPMYYCGMALHVLRLTAIQQPSYFSRQELRSSLQPPLRILFGESLVRQVVKRTKETQKAFEKDLERYLTLQTHLTKLETESKGEKIREASNSQQLAVLQALQDERKKKKELFDELEGAMNDARARKAASKQREKQQDAAITKKAINKSSSLPQALESDDHTRKIIEEAKQELIEKYGQKMSTAEARLNELRGNTTEGTRATWGPPINPFSNSLTSNLGDQRGKADDEERVGQEDTLMEDGYQNMDGIDSAQNIKEEERGGVQYMEGQEDDGEDGVQDGDLSMVDANVYSENEKGENGDQGGDTSMAGNENAALIRKGARDSGKRYSQKRTDTPKEYVNKNGVLAGEEVGELPQLGLENKREEDEQYLGDDCDSHHTYISDAGAAEDERESDKGPRGHKENARESQRVQFGENSENEMPHTKPSDAPESERSSESSEEQDYINSVTVPVEVIISKCLTSVIATQYSVINAQLMNLLLRTGLLEHLSALRRYLLMDSGDFADQLSGRLFEELAKPDARGIPHPHTLNLILETSLKVTGYDEDPLAKNLAFVYTARSAPPGAKTDPAAPRPAFHPHSLSTLDTFHLDYTLPFPLTLVIDRAAREKYHELFKFLLSLKRVAHALREIWIFCKRRKAYGYEESNNMIELVRHEMQHFVNILQEYVINQILDICWKEFSFQLDKVKTAEIDLNDLRTVHDNYLNKAKSRCLLHNKGAPGAKIIRRMFDRILEVWNILRSHPIDNIIPVSVHKSILDKHESFKTNAKFLYGILANLSGKRNQPHLQQLLLLINYNEFYSDSAQ